MALPGYSITMWMPAPPSATAAPADVIADIVSPDQLDASSIVPRVFDERVAPVVARAVVVASRHGIPVRAGARESALP